MGRDLTLYTRTASRSDLKDYLESLGFTKSKHLWSWPAGTLNYHWFDETDFKSIDGVSADVFPVSGEELEITGNKWALHVRNVYSASWHDVKMLNEVLREAKRKFGGTIKGDYGTNRYAALWKDESTPISRGISMSYQRVKRELDALSWALPDALMKTPAPKPDDAKALALAETMNRFDPARVIYNGLVPFAVSMFEFFFSSAFKVLVAYDSAALKKRNEHNARVDFATLLRVHRREETVEDVIASSYTFQNLDQLNKGYKDWLGIDVRKILFKRRRIGRKVAYLENLISELIQYRHGVVHRFELDRSLSKDKYLAILAAVEASMDEFVTFIEKRYGVTIDRSS